MVVLVKCAGSRRGRVCVCEELGYIMRRRGGDKDRVIKGV
jgi:hypothetical protein